MRLISRLARLKKEGEGGRKEEEETAAAPATDRPTAAPSLGSRARPPLQRESTPGRSGLLVLRALHGHPLIWTYS